MLPVAGLKPVALGGINAWTWMLSMAKAVCLPAVCVGNPKGSKVRG